MMFDAGMALAPATFFGALAIGLVLCSWTIDSTFHALP